MKLHDTSAPGPMRCPDTIWEMIPWYVNGSLPDDEAAAVTAHADSCPDCAAEIANQRVLARQVATTDPFEPPLARSWDALRKQIEADATARAPQPTSRGLFAGLHGGVVALIGSVAVACVVVFLQVSAPADGTFVTLTGGTDDAAQQIKLQPATGLDAAALAALLSAEGIEIVNGPSEMGVYTVAVPAEADPARVADTLMALPEIDFAAPEEN